MLSSRLCVVVIAVLVQYASAKSIALKRRNELPPTCDSKIYCQGEVLRVVQMARLFEDSKTFVDMSMLFTPDEVIKHFEDMMERTGNKTTTGDLKEFLAQNFIEGKELEDWTPPDHKANPEFLNKIHDAKVKTFAQQIVEIWPKLGRKVVDDVKNNPDLHSLIYVPNGFIIPGGRFREFYYWDSYWIVQGLLISEMYQTTKGMLENFLHMVDKYGFVPNGGRVYYLNRSQPPLLTKMAKEYYDATKDLEWISQHLPTLVKEVQWWVNNKFTSITIDGTTHKLATYVSESLGPRPESYREDVETSAMFPDEESQQKLFNELKGAAQSGWDFSTRWIFDENGDVNANISFTQTSRVVPVDLNAILYGAFCDLSYLYSVLKKSTDQKVWTDHAKALKEAIHQVLWNEDDGTWYDYDIKLQTGRKRFAASNLSPLWTKAYDVGQKTAYGSKVANYLKKEMIHEYKGGIPSTKIHSNEQWDFPNAWPPSQTIVVHGLKDTGEPEAMALAESFAQNWITANMIGFKEHGSLFEKYDAVSPGQYGGGGEYQVQTGFGWTNGAVINFINTYPNAVSIRKRKLKPAKKLTRQH